MATERSLLLLTRYGPLGSSSRLRMLQYVPWLEQAGFRVTASPFFADAYLRRLYGDGHGGLAETIAAYGRRVRALLRAGACDLVWVEKELFPFLPGVFESVLGRRRIPYVVDYDDATFHRYDLHRSGLVRRVLGGKLESLISAARSVTAGNPYLARYAEGAGARDVRILPTVVDLDRYAPAPDPGYGEFRIGWIGSPSTTKLLALLTEPLERLAQELPVRLVTIGAGRMPELEIPVERHPWSEDSEVALLGSVHAGIMPLEDEPWQRGKCGYKLVQYMACCKPVVASPVGVNADIVTESCGFLAREPEQWFDSLHKLALDPSLRSAMGTAGRACVERHYALQATGPIVVELLSGALAH